ncbi:hypothetical protein AVEN_129602-1, partial [Araneus ventricosus]
ESDFRPQTSDSFLLRFLRAKKYDIRRAFKTLQNYYIFKARYSGLITDFTPKDVRNVIEMNNLLIMPQRHPSGAAVSVLRLGNYCSAPVYERFTMLDILVYFYWHD